MPHFSHSPNNKTKVKYEYLANSNTHSYNISDSFWAGDIIELKTRRVTSLHALLRNRVDFLDEVSPVLHIDVAYIIRKRGVSGRARSSCEFFANWIWSDLSSFLFEKKEMEEEGKEEVFKERQKKGRKEEEENEGHWMIRDWTDRRDWVERLLSLFICHFSFFWTKWITVLQKG